MPELIVTIPANFVPERTYAIDVLLSEFLGIAYELRIVEASKDFLLTLGGNRLVVRDGFFGRLSENQGYLDSRHVPIRCAEFRAEGTGSEGLPIIYGREEFAAIGGEIVCGLDIFASSFFMLTRWEEHVSGERDQHGRFPAACALAHRNDFLDRPVVNQYADLLWSLLCRMGWTSARKPREFRLSPTHDVDEMYEITARRTLRNCAGDLLKRRSPVAAARTAGELVRTRLGVARDPFDTFDWLMDLSDQAGLKSTFNFMTGGRTQYDRGTQLSPSRKRALLEHIDRRGHAIGFHPSYDAFNDKELWGSEWDELNRLCSRASKVGREHFLRFAFPTTWQIWDDYGMAWDSSLGFAEREGFRCGVCYEYPVFNVITRKQLRLRERPLIAMDVTLARYRALSPADCESRLRDLMGSVRLHRGEFVLLWHNSNLSGPQWKPYRSVYQRVLESAS